MKRLYIILLLAIPLVLQSCLKEQEDLFDKSPAERMNDALIAYNDLLISSTEGWLLEYYPERNQSYGGYNYVIQFAKEGVTAYTEIALDVTQPSNQTLYQVIADYGPVLTFDSYNEYLHAFAEPSALNYQAFQGDFEFLLMGTSESKDQIVLRGKKSGNDMQLRRMTESPVTYLQKVENMVMTLAPHVDYLIKIGTRQIECSLPMALLQRVLTYTYEGPDSEIITEEIAFCVSDQGIHLYRPIDIDGITASEFKLDGANLVSLDGKVIIEPQ